jgi:hypothetical protein
MAQIVPLTDTQDLEQSLKKITMKDNDRVKDHALSSNTMVEGIQTELLTHRYEISSGTLKDVGG